LTELEKQTMSKVFKTIFFLLAAMLLALPLISLAESTAFNVEQRYDFYGRQEISAQLVKNTDLLSFYADDKWWQDLSSSEKWKLMKAFDDLADEFEAKAYPTLTDLFGSEPSGVIDKEEKIIVLLHAMYGEVGGYVNSGDLYEKVQNPKSNEGKILYLNSKIIDKPEADYFLAHEFMHLITGNQKNLLRGLAEEVWLNEARAEYTSTLLGYDDVYEGSNLERRVESFLQRPSTSLSGWLERSEDYGAVNLFTQYLVDHYGLEILVDSLHSNKAGAESINYALAKNHCGKDFSDVFADWLVALLINDCEAGEEYCYLNEHLEDLRVTPTFYYLPKTGTVLATHQTSYWTPKWQRFVGGSNHLTLNFSGADSVNFKVPYVLCDLENNCSVSLLSPDEKQDGELVLSDFSSQYGSFTIMPFIDSKTAGFNGLAETFSFSWQVKVEELTPEEKEAELIDRLLARVEELEQQIADYRAKIALLLSDRGQISCHRLENDLFSGMRNSAEVSCLQEFLKAQGPEIYPEGLVTGNFFSLTEVAVIRFQEQYATEILAPLGLEKGTGYVGPATRLKINQILG